MEKTTIRFDDACLPARITVPGFGAAYKDYADAATAQNYRLRLHRLGCTATYILGIALVLAGAAFIVFGPTQVWVNRFTGPTFLQFFQLYPGPIATAGFALAWLGLYLLRVNTIRPQSPVEFLLANHVLLPQGHEPAELPQGDEPVETMNLMLIYQENDQFEISFLGPDKHGGISQMKKADIGE